MTMAQSKFSLSPDDALFVSKHLPNCQLKDQLAEFAKTYPVNLNEKILAFLSNHELSIAWIPKIEVLGKYKGGFALVKEISQAGGLKKVRPRYARYLLNKMENGC